MNVQVILVLVMFVAIVPALCTAGAVLWVSFWARGAGQWTRILAAAIGGPFVALGFVILVAVMQEGASPVVLMTISVFLLVPMVVIGLPIAYFSTRKLDRLLMARASIFE